MRKKILLWGVGIVLAIGVFSSLGNTSNPQVQGVSTTVTQTPTAKPTSIPTQTVTPTPSATAAQTTYTVPQTYNNTQTVSPNTDQSAGGLSNDNYYTNSSGNQVHSPAYSNNGSVPAGATAQCGDGTYSFSQHRSGTCSHHGGVAQWY